MKKDTLEVKYTSSTSTLPIYELKLRQQYQHDKNLQQLSEAIPAKKKDMTLLQFLKNKRYQQVVIKWLHDGRTIETAGKVELVGRDFVIITRLFHRYWFPFSVIASADTPFGLPNVSSHTHQHLVFDQRLRKQLTTDFGKTVNGRNELIRHFFEQSMESHLKTWKGNWFQVYTKNNKSSLFAKVKNDKLYTVSPSREHTLIECSDIVCIHSMRLLSIFRPIRSLFQKRSS